MSGPGRWLPPVGVALLAAGFAYLNRAERVQVELGVVDFYASSALVILAAFLLGMTAMLLLGLRQDLRLREELRARGLLDGAASLPAPLVEPDRVAVVDPPHDGFGRTGAVASSDDGTDAAPALPDDRTLLHPNPTRDDPSPA